MCYGFKTAFAILGAMNLETKAQLSRVTLYLLMLIASLFVVGTVVIVLSTAVEINPFRERTSAVLAVAFACLVGTAFAALFLNVAANLSLIAEAKALESHVTGRKHGLRPWYIGVAAAALVAAAVVVGGARVSHRRFLAVVRAQAQELLAEHDELVGKAAAALAAGRSRDMAKVPELLHFIESQRSGLPDLSLIYAGKFQGRRALRVIGQYGWDEDSAKKNVPPPYFSCDRGVDCEYLKSFFDGEPSRMFEKADGSGSYLIYMPFERAGARFVLRFGRRYSYGKIGSS